MPFKLVEVITVCVDYDRRYELPPNLVNVDTGIGRQDHVGQILTGQRHAVPLIVVSFEPAGRCHDLAQQMIELEAASLRPAVAEDFRAAAEVLLKRPRPFSIYADGTSFNHPHGGGSRFVLSLIRDDSPWRVFAAWPELRSQPEWCMLVAPLEPPAAIKAA